MNETQDEMPVAEELRANYGALSTEQLEEERTVIINRNYRRYDGDGDIPPLDDYDALVVDVIDGILYERAQEATEEAV